MARCESRLLAEGKRFGEGALLRITGDAISILIRTVTFLLCVLPCFATAPDRAHLTILSTTDLHGNLYPFDYNSNKPDARGLARVATMVKEIRRENPNLLLLDSGDTIQGTPLTFYHGKIDNSLPDPMMTVMSAIGYDAMAVGNHEYEFGLAVLDKARGEARFPWLSANTYRKKTTDSYFQPYVVKQLGGVRVGIIGLTTPCMPSLDDPEAYYSKIEIREPVSEAKKWVPLLRNKERVDLVIIAMHMGLEVDLKTGEKIPGQMPNENAAVAIAENVPDIDVILMGHTHREVPSAYINGVLLTQSEKWGRSIAKADIYLKRSPGDRWRVVAKSSRSVPVGESVEADPEILRIGEPYHQKTQAWLEQVIGNCPIELKAGDERFRDTPILDLVHRVQLELGNADVSTAMTLNSKARLGGPVTIRDIIAFYEYEATPIVVEVTGKQLKEMLEHSARHFREYRPNVPLTEMTDERFPSYTYDVAEGISYELDISKAVGERLQNIRLRGQPVTPHQKLRLATITFRVNGGAGYTMFEGARVIYRSRRDLRELIIDWIKKNRNVPTTPTNNWRLLPASPT